MSIDTGGDHTFSVGRHSADVSIATLWLAVSGLSVACQWPVGDISVVNHKNTTVSHPKHVALLSRLLGNFSEVFATFSDDPGKSWTGSEVISVFRKSSDINSSPNLTPAVVSTHFRPV